MAVKELFKLGVGFRHTFPGGRIKTIFELI